MHLLSPPMHFLSFPIERRSSPANSSSPVNKTVRRAIFATCQRRDAPCGSDGLVGGRWVHHPLVPRDVAQDTTPLRHVALPKAVVAALLGHGATDGGHDPQSVASTPRSNHRPRIQESKQQERKLERRRTIIELHFVLYGWRWYRLDVTFQRHSTNSHLHYQNGLLPLELATSPLFFFHSIRVSTVRNGSLSTSTNIPLLIQVITHHKKASTHSNPAYFVAN
jgi:hypothetical protein